MNFVVYPVYKKKNYSEKKILVQPLANNGQNKTSSNKKKTSNSTIRKSRAEEKKL